MGNNQQKQKQKEEEEQRIKKLIKNHEDNGVESWGVADFIDYLKLHGFQNKQVFDLLIQYQLDGDGLITSDLQWFSSLFDQESLASNAKCLEFLQTKQKEEHARQLLYVLPHKPIDELFPPYQIPEELVDIVLFYHNNTKNTLEDGARTVKRDWLTQPRIWRRYYGAPIQLLPIPVLVPKDTNENNNIKKITYDRPTIPSTDIMYDDLFEYHKVQSKPFDMDSISILLHLSFALSGRKPAWHMGGMPRSYWSKRINASSGGLHPVECYFMFPSDLFPSKKSSLAHYSIKEHAFEFLAEIPDSTWGSLTQNLPKNSFFASISSVNWREIWKYGERAFRYCQLDIGHAYTSLRVAVAALGWQMYLIKDITDEDLGNILGINQLVYVDETEREHPALLFLIVPSQTENREQIMSELRAFGETRKDVLKSLSTDLKRAGKHNQLSYGHTEWPIITAATKASKKVSINKKELQRQQQQIEPSTSDSNTNNNSKEESEKSSLSAFQVIRTRRSALEFLPQSIPKSQFERFLKKISPIHNKMPWDTWNEQGFHVNLGVFVYRVTGMTPGYYMFIRNPSELEKLKEATSTSNFEWRNSEEICEELRPYLFLLKAGEETQVATDAADSSCKQDLVGRSTFCCAMFTNLEDAVKEDPSNYRARHWECGAIGQLLYLEAFSFGLSATGLGCFIDDSSSQLFGLVGSSFRPLYHITVGHGSKDVRYPAYNYEKAMAEFLKDADSPSEKM